MESTSTSKKKRKLKPEQKLCSEQNAYYKKLRREQKKKRKRKNNVPTNQPQAVKVKKVAVTDFLSHQLKKGEVKANEILPTGKMVSAVLRDAGTLKKGKSATTSQRAEVQSSSKVTANTDVTELSNVKRITGAKSIGSGTFGTCFPRTFRGIRVVIKEYNGRICQDDASRGLK